MSSLRQQGQFIANQLIRKCSFPAYGWKWYLIVFVLAFLGFISRRPDAVFNPQFWAEDGVVFYQFAYQLGPFNTLFSAYAGYLHLLPRLTAALSLLFPLSWAPLVFNLMALAIQTLPIMLLLSQRFSNYIPDRRIRLLLAFLYIGIPNCSEVYATITNSQWHLAILAFMVMLAQPNRSLVWAIFDVTIVLLSALSGPFSIILLPLAVAYLYQARRQSRPLGRLPKYLWILAMGSFMQTLSIVFTASVSRHLSPAPPTFFQFAKAIAGQVFLGTLLGQNGYQAIAATNWFALGAPVILLVGLVAIAYCLLKGPQEIKLLIVFAGLTFGACVISLDWKTAWLPGAMGRYCFVPIVTCLASLVWLLSRRNPVSVRAFAGACLSITLLVGVVLDWHQPPLPDYHFQLYAQQFNTLSSGSVLQIPINPDGQRWIMTLKKH